MIIVTEKKLNEDSIQKGLSATAVMAIIEKKDRQPVNFQLAFGQSSIVSSIGSSPSVLRYNNARFSIETRPEITVQARDIKQGAAYTDNMGSLVRLVIDIVGRSQLFIYF